MKERLTVQNVSKARDAYLGSLRSSGHGGMGRSRLLVAQTHKLRFRLATTTARSFVETRERFRRSYGRHYAAIWNPLQLRERRGCVDEAYFEEYVHRDIHERVCLLKVASEISACVCDFLAIGRRLCVC